MYKRQTLLHDVDASAETDARKRMELKSKLQSDFEAKAQKIHAISQLLKAYSLYQLDVEYVCLLYTSRCV